MTRPDLPADPSDILVSRRSVLAAATWGVAGMALLGGGWHKALASTGLGGDRAPSMFMPVSRLLTGHVLDDSLKESAWHALNTREADFSNRFAALSNAVSETGLESMTHWANSSIAKDKALTATALSVVSAWYLGRIGEMQERSPDGPEFITYAGALMWRPTLDVTVIPTYSRGKPGFWKDKPAPPV